MFNHIVGRLDIDLETFKTRQTVVVGTPWTAYYGVPKVPLRDNQGFSYPFALSHYTASAAAGGASNEAHLLLVSEVRKSILRCSLPACARRLKVLQPRPVPAGEKRTYTPGLQA